MNWLNIWKRYGATQAVHYFGYRCLQRLILLDVTHLMVLDVNRAEPTRKSHSSVEFRFLSAAEVRTFSDDPANDLDRSLAQRLETGLDYCFAAIQEGWLASYCWLARHSVEAEHNRCTEDPRSGVAISFPADTAFRYKGYTHPDFRGRRLYEEVTKHAAAAMNQLGVRYVLSTAEWVNFAALRSCRRGGFEHLGLVILFVLANKKVSYGPARIADRGIAIGRRAQVLSRDCGGPSGVPRVARAGSNEPIRNEKESVHA